MGLNPNHPGCDETASRIDRSRAKARRDHGLFSGAIDTELKKNREFYPG
jgi:hypothetical protein